jgi:hypothetical protein
MGGDVRSTSRSYRAECAGREGTAREYRALGSGWSCVTGRPVNGRWVPGGVWLNSRHQPAERGTRHRGATFPGAGTDVNLAVMLPVAPIDACRRRSATVACPCPTRRRTCRSGRLATSVVLSRLPVRIVPQVSRSGSSSVVDHRGFDIRRASYDCRSEIRPFSANDACNREHSSSRRLMCIRRGRSPSWRPPDPTADCYTAPPGHAQPQFGLCR